MSNWEHIIEARIREWQARPESERRSAPSGPGAPPLEVQLFDEIVFLLREARKLDEGEERSALEERARETQLRLMVLLEKYDRPLLVKNLAARIEEAVTAD